MTVPFQHQQIARKLALLQETDDLQITDGDVEEVDLGYWVPAMIYIRGSDVFEYLEESDTDHAMSKQDCGA